jgi:hypothetical protein
MCAFNGTQCSIEYEHERRITIDGYQKTWQLSPHLRLTIAEMPSLEIV